MMEESQMKYCTGMFHVQFSRRAGKHVTKMESHFTFDSMEEALESYHSTKAMARFCGGGRGSLYPVEQNRCPECSACKKPQRKSVRRCDGPIDDLSELSQDDRDYIDQNGGE